MNEELRYLGFACLVASLGKAEFWRGMKKLR
jgi:hypothetical protein